MLEPGNRRLKKPAIDCRLIMRLVVSLALLSASLLVILVGQYDPNSKHWAYATVGTIMGYWFRSTR